MNRFLRGVAACLTLLPASAGWSQSLPPAQQPPAAGITAAARQAPPAVRPQPAPPAGELRPAFSDYVPFDLDVALVDWRAANEQVRSAGGHAGLVRSQDARADKLPAGHKSATPKGHH